MGYIPDRMPHPHPHPRSLIHVVTCHVAQKGQDQTAASYENARVTRFHSSRYVERSAVCILTISRYAFSASWNRHRRPASVPRQNSRICYAATTRRAPNVTTGRDRPNVPCNREDPCPPWSKDRPGRPKEMRARCKMGYRENRMLILLDGQAKKGIGCRMSRSCFDMYVLSYEHAPSSMLARRLHVRSPGRKVGEPAVQQPTSHVFRGGFHVVLSASYWALPGLPPPWQPRSCLFMLLLTLNAFPQPACWHLKGFSPVCEWLWIRRLDGLENALLHVWHT